VGGEAETQRCYAGEAEAFAYSSFVLPVGMGSLVILAQVVAEHPWWTSRGLGVPTVTKAAAGQKRSSALKATAQIRVAESMDCVAMLCHELAHLSTSRGCAAHGAEYRTAHVALVGLVGGGKAAERLPQCYRAAGLSSECEVSGDEAGLAGVFLDAPNGTYDREACTMVSGCGVGSVTWEDQLRAGISAERIAEAEVGSGWVVNLGTGAEVAKKCRALGQWGRELGCEIVWTNVREGRVVRVSGGSRDVAKLARRFKLKWSNLSIMEQTPLPWNSCNG